MSRLRQAVLENLRILGNHSGCHQLPERSFFYKGKQFPVCARCTGVLIGQMSAILFMIFAFIINPITSAILLLIMGIDWFIQYIDLLESTNVRRLISGSFGGFGLFNLYGFFITSIIKNI